MTNPQTSRARLKLGLPLVTAAILLSPCLLHGTSRGQVVVESVTLESAAHTAGVRAGDRLQRYGRVMVTSPAALVAAVENRQGTEPVTIEWVREGRRQRSQVAAGNLGMVVIPTMRPEWMALHQDARQALEQDDLEAAEKSWLHAAEQALRAQDRETAAWLFAACGEARAANKDQRAARDHFARAVSTAEDSTSRSYYLAAQARACLMTRRYTEAGECAGQARRLDLEGKRPWWACLNLHIQAAVLANTRRSEAARQRFTEFIKEAERLKPNHAQVGLAYLNRAQIEARFGDDDPSWKSYQAAIRILSATHPQSLTLARTHLKAGYAARRAGLRDEAEAQFHSAVAIYRRQDRGGGNLAEALAALGKHFEVTGQWEQAEAPLREAIERYSAARVRSYNALSARVLLGIVARKLGRYDESERHLNGALDWCRQGRYPSSVVARVWDELASTQREAGNFAAARHYCRQGMQLRNRAASPSKDLTQSWMHMARIEIEAGNLSLGDEYLQRTLESKPASLEAAGCYNLLGLIARTRGDFASARTWFRKALDRSVRHQDPRWESNLRHNLALVELRLGNLSAARDQLNAAIRMKRSHAASNLTIARSLHALSSIQLQLNELEKAEATLDQHRELLRNGNQQSPEVAQYYLARAELARQRGDQKATNAARESAWNACRNGFPDSIYSVPFRIEIARRRLDDGQWQSALPVIEQAVRLLEEQRESIRSGETRMLFVEHQAAAFGTLIRAQVAAGKPANAFATLERLRSRTLTELIASHGRRRETLPETLQIRQRELSDAFTEHYRLVSLPVNESNAAREEANRQRLQALKVQRRQLEADIHRASPRYAAGRKPKPIDLSQAQALLPAGALLVAYHLRGSQSLLFCVWRPENDKDPGIRVHPLELSEQDVAHQVTSFRNRLRARQPLAESGAHLYQVLLGPAEDLLRRSQRLLISGDGALHQLPFAALVADQTDQGPTYLVDLLPFRHINSMTVVRETRRRVLDDRPRPELDLLVLADPTFGSRRPTLSPTRGLTLVPKKTPRTKPTGTSTTVATPAGSESHDFPPLQAARREAAEVARAFTGSHEIRLGEQASERFAKQSLENARIAHFACHGFVDDRDPLASGLALAPGQDEDGILRAWEIEQMRGGATRLVVLSCCESGLGEVRRFEGVQGLTRAFQSFGADSLVVSLWGVADQSTERLMVGFYQQLATQQPLDESLRTAALRVRKDPRWQHPFYWAPFILVGEPAL